MPKPKDRGAHAEWQAKMEAKDARVKKALQEQTANLKHAFDHIESACATMGTALNDLQPSSRLEGMRYNVGDILRQLDSMRLSTKILEGRSEAEKKEPA